MIHSTEALMSRERTANDCPEIYRWLLPWTLHIHLLYGYVYSLDLSHSRFRITNEGKLLFFIVIANHCEMFNDRW